MSDTELSKTEDELQQELAALRGKLLLASRKMVDAAAEARRAVTIEHDVPTLRASILTREKQLYAARRERMAAISPDLPGEWHWTSDGGVSDGDVEVSIGSDGDVQIDEDGDTTYVHVDAMRAVIAAYDAKVRQP